MAVLRLPLIVQCQPCPYINTESENISKTDMSACLIVCQCELRSSLHAVHAHKMCDSTAFLVVTRTSLDVLIASSV